jgi:antitoxin VapB
MRTAKLFKNGRSQAVRLPKEFRFEGDEVYVRRHGPSVILTPKGISREEQWRDFFEALDSFDSRFPLVRDQPKGHQVRKSIEEWFGTAKRRTKRRK